MLGFSEPGVSYTVVYDTREFVYKTHCSILARSSGVNFMNITINVSSLATYVLGYFVACNLVAFIVYGWDKLRAGTGLRRVPEKTLLVLALVGGSLGALAGMKLFRHKTRKNSFIIWIILICLLQLAVVGYMVTRGAPGLLTTPSAGDTLSPF